MWVLHRDVNMALAFVKQSASNLAAVVYITDHLMPTTAPTRHQHPEIWARPQIASNTEGRKLRTAYRYPHDETNFLWPQSLQPVSSSLAILLLHRP